MTLQCTPTFSPLWPDVLDGNADSPLSFLRSGQFVYVIRKRIKLSPEKAIFIFVDEVLPPTAALMSTIYEEHKDEDGFLCVLLHLIFAVHYFLRLTGSPCFCSYVTYSGKATLLSRCQDCRAHCICPR